MTDFILLQNYARNFLMRLFMTQPSTLDVEPGYKGKLEVIATGWRGTLKVVGRERSVRSLLVDPKWEEEGAQVVAVYLLDAGRMWLIDAPKLYRLVERNRHLFEERYGKRVVPWSAITQHVGGQCVDLRGSTLSEFRAVPGSAHLSTQSLSGLPFCIRFTLEQRRREPCEMPTRSSFGAPIRATISNSLS